ncbi:MAG: DNA-directed RNA polymerase subunit omega [Desulforhopalus sp.]|nr:DNA-directed RNA polymerase subunit omega [Desulforhopalus sp.]
MARITCEDCLKALGDNNRFNLVHLTVERIHQHRQGEPFLSEGKNQEIVMTLREIANKSVSFNNINDLPNHLRGKKDEEESARGEVHS